ncbi:MAG: ribonuclease D [Holosporales bacterium]|jgi:ribonuclease D|nr:ribonuclease D [Holosporales bacterium]
MLSLDIKLYRGDLPDEFMAGVRQSIAVDTEAMGLSPHRDRLCVVQFCCGDDRCCLVQFDDYANAHNVRSVLRDDKILKIFHYARFDVSMFYKHLGVMAQNVYCTKIASKFARTYAAGHSLRDLCLELLGVEISKEQTCTDWGGEHLTEAQQEYAATDVIYLHALKAKLDSMLYREGRYDMAMKCFDFLQTRVILDLTAGEQYDIFSHST